MDEVRPYEPGAVSPVVRRVTAGAIKRRKGKTLFPVITAYDVPFARFAEEAGISKSNAAVRVFRAREALRQ